jgi:hypothetical protein
MYDLGADESKALLTLYSGCLLGHGYFVYRSREQPLFTYLSAVAPFSPLTNRTKHVHHPPPTNCLTVPRDPILIKESQIRLNWREAAAIDSDTGV